MLYVTLRQYEYVCAIGRYGSLSAAAQHLNVSQPALSNAVAKIESRLGHALFARKRGAAMALTPQGRAFVQNAEALLADAAHLEDASQINPGTDHLVLGCFEDLAPFLLAPALRQLRRALPDVEIRYDIQRFEGLVTGLIEGKTDLAITYDLGMDAGFMRQNLFDSYPNAMVSPEHPLSKQATLSLAELAPHPLILSTEGLSAQYVLGLFQRQHLHPIVAHRASSLELLRSLSAHGEGIGISYARPHGNVSYDGMPVVSIPITDPDAIESIVLARHGTGTADATVGQAEQVLIRHLSQV